MIFGADFHLSPAFIIGILIATDTARDAHKSTQVSNFWTILYALQVIH